MKLVAITMVKDEADIIEHTIRHMLAHGCDQIIVADNLSTDRTLDILDALVREFPERLVVYLDRVKPYYQAEKMTAMFEKARDFYGADWVVPFDADELFCTPKIGEYSLKQILETVSTNRPSYDVIEVPMWNHFPTFLDGGDNPNPFTRMVYRHTEPNALPKVIVRAQLGVKLAQGNHSVTIGGSSPRQSAYLFETPRGLHIRHFPYRSENQFITKVLNGAAAYKAAGAAIPADQGAHWRKYGQIFETFGHEGLRDHFKRWFYFGTDERIREMVLDPAPLRRI